MRAVLHRRWSALASAAAVAVVAAAVLAVAAPAHASAGDRVDDFALLDHEGRFHRLSYHADAPAIVLFVHGNGCPIARNALPALKALRDEWAPRGVVFWLLNANPQDDRQRIASEAASFDVDLPILVDETQLVAESLGVTRTAEAIVVDPSTWRIVYRGPIDDRLNYEAQRPVRHAYLRDALDAHLAGRPVEAAARAAPGCLVHLPDADREAHREISYAEQIAPLLAQRCGGCHRDGGVAPWSMSSYEMVRGWSPMMREVVRTRRMPPWHADPHVSRFENDLSLSVEETRLLVHWIEAGAPRGEGPDPLREAAQSKQSNPSSESKGRAFVPVSMGAAAAAGDAEAWTLGPPDLVLTLPTQSIPATGVVEYRYETLDVPLESDAWIRGVEIRPSNAAVMHHGTAYLIPPAGGRVKTEGPSFTRGLFAGYVPGREAEPFPDDTAVFLPAGSRIRFQLHYTTTGRAEEDTPRMALHLSREPVSHELKIGAAVNYGFEIPAGARDHEDVARRTLEKDILVYQLSPHMHFRGKRMRFEAHHPDGRVEPLLSVPNYNFNWQRRYVLAEPRRLPAGTTIEVRAGFDNSDRNPANPDPDSPVYWGEQSFEEMLIGYFVYRELAPGESVDERLAEHTPGAGR